MQYQVPQFIEVEDKIFGPLTFKQFVYVVGGGALAFIFYRFLPSFISIFFVIGTIGVASALAFYKVNDRPFINTVESAFNYYKGTKLYTWQMREAKEKIEKPIEAKIASPVNIPVQKSTQDKLRDISTSLDIKTK
ncbi:MAG: PrgI family protein [Patescibacteria group bacterium]